MGSVDAFETWLRGASAIPTSAKMMLFDADFTFASRVGLTALA